jgi:hypothetical protein
MSTPKIGKSISEILGGVENIDIYDQYQAIPLSMEDSTILGPGYTTYILCDTLSLDFTDIVIIRIDSQGKYHLGLRMPISGRDNIIALATLAQNTLKATMKMGGEIYMNHLALNTHSIPSIHSPYARV